MKRYILLLLAAAFTSMMTHAQETSISDVTTSVVAADNVAVAADTATVEKRDKSSRFLPTSRRIDRHVDRNKFVYKGEVMLGLAASHGKLSVEDSELMLLVDDINIGLNSTTVKPFLAFAYRDNRSVGMRFGYEYIRGDLGCRPLVLAGGLGLEERELLVVVLPPQLYRSRPSRHRWCDYRVGADGQDGYDELLYR